MSSTARSLVLFLILLGLIAIPILLLSNSAGKLKLPDQQTTALPNIQNVTPENADTTLASVDGELQSSDTQIDSDMQEVDSIDTSTDDESGL